MKGKHNFVLFALGIKVKSRPAELKDHQITVSSSGVCYSVHLGRASLILLFLYLSCPMIRD